METKQNKSKEYMRPMPTNWWLKRTNYLLFIVRETTCVFVGLYAIYLLILAMLRDEPDSFAAWLQSPTLIVLQIVALPFLLFHSITWINLTPKVLVVWRGEERVPPSLIAAAHFGGWLIVSLIIFWIAFQYG